MIPYTTSFESRNKNICAMVSKQTAVRQFSTYLCMIFLVRISNIASIPTKDPDSTPLERALKRPPISEKKSSRGTGALDGSRCFVDSAGDKRCFPNVFFIGVSKCGA
ncbi:unnamed protein product [Choristocarpus tenellus]